MFSATLAAVLSAAGLIVGAQSPQPVGTWAGVGAIDGVPDGAASVALADGRTLLIGGVASSGAASDAVLVYDPVTNALSPAGQLLAPRVQHTATLLDDGRVLVAGGVVNEELSADLELFDPAFGTSASGGALAQGRAGHAAARLPNGDVLIVGGTTAAASVSADGELVDPATGGITILSSTLNEPRVGASATTLIDGRVLVAGGRNGSGDLATAEVFEAYSQTFAPTDTRLSVARSGHTAVLLPHNNSVLVAGGTSAGQAVSAADLFLPAQFPDPYFYGMGSFIAAAPMDNARTGAAGAPGPSDGFAVIAGGGAADSERYRFATIKTDKDDYAPGEPAVITGSGWQPGEEVTLLFQEDPAVHDDYVLRVTADAAGNIYWDQWAPEQHDFGVRFYLMAWDSRSKAQTTFTDGNKISFSTTANGSEETDFGTLAPNVCFSVFVQERQGGNIDDGNHPARSVTLSSGPTGATFHKDAACGGGTNQVTSVTIPANQPAVQFWFKIGSTGTYTINGVGVGISGANNNASATVTVLKAATTTTVTCPAAPLAYTGASIEPCTATVSGPGLSQALTVSYVNNVNAGTATANASYAESANYLGSSDSETFTIAKAPTTTTVTCGTGPSTYTGSAIEPCTATVSGPELNDSLTVSYANNVNAGTATANASYAESANYLGSSDSENFIIDKAPTTTTVTCVAGPHVYSGDEIKPCSASVSGPGLNLSPDVLYSNNIAAGTATASVSYAESANYLGSSDSENFIIDKAPTTTTVTCLAGPHVYSGGEIKPCSASVSGPGLNLSPDVLYSNNIAAGTATASASYAESANYFGSSDSENFIIDKAPTTTTVTCGTGTFTYTGTVIEPCTATVSGPGLNQSLTVTYVNNVNAGTATSNASYPASANYLGSSGSATFTIAQAPTTTTVTCGPGLFTYTGTAIEPCEATVSGPGLDDSLTVTYVNNVNAGTATANASYPASANYLGSSGSATFTIAQAPTTTTVTCGPGLFTYTGTAIEPCNATVSGPGLNQSLTVTYVNNVNAGTATANASYTESANYLGSSGSETFTIAQAPTTTTVTCLAGPFVFDGTAFTPCSASVTGAGGLNESVTVNYSNNVNAGTATANASYAASTNYLGSTDSETFTIAKAPTTTTVTCGAGPFVFSGTAFTPCSASVTGAGGLNESVTVNYSNNVNAGTATANASYAASTNHLGSGDSETFTIAKAPTTTTVTCPAGPFVFDGTAFTPCSASVTGAGGLNESVTVNYSNNVNAGTATASASYAASANYLGSNDSESFTIAQAPTTTTVTCPTGPFVFSGSAFTPCSASVTGAGGLNQSLTINYSDNVNAGTATANASYAESANHFGSSGSAQFTIDKAPQVITFTSIAPDPFTLGSTYAVAATGGASGNAVVFSSLSPTVCSVTGNVVQSLAIGACIVAANQAGNANYHAANQATQAFGTHFAFTGFFRPVDNLPVLNSVKAGSAIPLKFSLNGYQGMEIFAPHSPLSGVVSCYAQGGIDEVTETLTAGNSSLHYDATVDQYVYVWKTEKNWSNCRQLVVRLKDGKEYKANFLFKK